MWGEERGIKRLGNCKFVVQCQPAFAQLGIRGLSDFVIYFLAGQNMPFSPSMAKFWKKVKGK